MENNPNIPKFKRMSLSLFIWQWFCLIWQATPVPSVPDYLICTPLLSPPKTAPSLKASHTSVGSAKSALTLLDTPPVTPAPSIGSAQTLTPQSSPPYTPLPSIASAKTLSPQQTPPKSPSPSVPSARTQSPLGTSTESPAPSVPQCTISLTPDYSRQPTTVSSAQSVPTAEENMTPHVVVSTKQTKGEVNNAVLLKKLSEVAWPWLV